MTKSSNQITQRTTLPTSMKAKATVVQGQYKQFEYNTVIDSNLEQKRDSLTLRISQLRLKIEKKRIQTSNLMSLGDENPLEFVVLSAMRFAHNQEVKHFIKQVDAIRQETEQFLASVDTDKYSDLLNYYQKLGDVGSFLTTNMAWDEQVNDNLATLGEVLDDLYYSLERLSM